MARSNVVAGIDVGTSRVRTIIAQRPGNEDDKPQIVGVGEANTAGMRKGMVIDIEEVVNSINESVEQAERMSGLPVESAYISVGGSDIISLSSKGAIAVSRADGEVTHEDIGRAINAASAISVPNNREIVHVIPRKYSLDNQSDIKDPIGMTGVRLEADCLIIQASSPHLKNISKCVYQAGINIEDLVLAPIAGQMATLTKRQKELGVVLINIGGGTTSVAVYEEGELLHVGIIPVGGNNVTNDIAIGLRTSIDVAEEVKIKYGSCTPDEISKKDQVDLSKFDKSEENVVSRKHVAEIIEARMEEIFKLVNKELKIVDRDGMLPAGAVIVGGSSKVMGCVDLAKEVLKLPTQNGFPKEIGGIVDKVDEPGFITALGLIFWGMEAKKETNFSSSFPNVGELSQSVGQSVGKIKKWLQGFMP